MYKPPAANELDVLPTDLQVWMYEWKHTTAALADDYTLAHWRHGEGSKSEVRSIDHYATNLPVDNQHPREAVPRPEGKQTIKG